MTDLEREQRALDLHEQIHELTKENICLRERERILREALEFYANQDSWEWNGSIREDGGKHSGYGLKAREALKKAEEMK